ncbi:hypothetical protein V6N11_035232 [Hibiscus sabdariffa]|uniref:Uncharacterized protein n=1 Tax=Hibiscus sabdariffa TaxID=183260 RepID=A0ABR2R0H4_9ROSI
MAILLVGELCIWKKRICLVNIYALNDEGDRRTFFAALAVKVASFQVPILMGGDFSAILAASERVGSSFNNNVAADFTKFIDDLNLISLPLIGASYT